MSKSFTRIAAVLVGLFITSAMCKADTRLDPPTAPTLASCVKAMPSGAKIWTLDQDCR